MKNILFASSECVPFIKTGGLADVVGSLPKDFDKEKYDVRVVIPKYMCMKQEWKEKQYVEKGATETSDNNFFTQSIRSIAKMMAGSAIDEVMNQLFLLLVIL